MYSIFLSITYKKRTTLIIEEDETNKDTVTLGKSVTFVELPDGDEETYTIVGSAEADPFEGKISNDSPIAKSLLGRKVQAYRLH